MACIVWSLSLPLRDIFAYPHRVSVFPNLEADAANYHALAMELAATGRNNIPAKFPPLWISLMAAVYALVGPSFVAGKLISWTALVVIVLLAAWLARRMYGPSAGWAAALLCSISPGLRAYVGTLQYEVTTGMFLLLALVLAARVVHATPRAHWRRGLVFAGLAGALLIVTRETLVLAVLLIAVWIGLQLSATVGRRVAISAAAMYLAAASTLPLAWTVVQSAREGRLIPVAEKGPKEFALGNHPTANGTYNEPLVGMAEPAGIPFIMRHPSRALVLMVRKALYFWGVLRDGWTAPQAAGVWLWRATTGVLPFQLAGSIARGGWLLAAFLLALWLLGGAGWQRWWVVPAVVMALWAVHIASLSSFRFAVPILPVAYVMVSGPAASLAREAARALRVPLIALCTVFVAAMATAAQFESWPLQVSYAASELDGLIGSNEADEVTGMPVRLAPAKHGERPIVLLADEYLPRGPLTVTVSLRLVTAAHGPVARVALIELDGTPACVSTVPGTDLSTEQFKAIDVFCRLRRDGPATLAIFTLGAADLAIDRVNLSWAP